MYLNLGKIFLLLIFIQLSLFSKVKLEVNESYFQGDSVAFKIIASGENVEIPEIKKIGSYSVRGAGTSKQTNIFNGQKTTTIIKTFQFFPKGDITLPAFKVVVDGKNYTTKEKKIKMVKVEKTKSNLYSFDLKVNKKELFVGEALELQINFKYRKDLSIVSLEFEKPNFDGFWVKKLNNKTPDNDPVFFHQSLTYLLFPQKSGKVILEPMKINVITSSGNYSNSFFFTGSTRATPVYSNSIELSVKPLPKGIDLIGKYMVESEVDKLQVKAGEAISYKIKIKGEGNIDDIPEFKLNIPEVTIYENPSKKSYSVTNGVYGGEYTKVFSIVASKSFTIRPVKLEYFDQKDQTTKKIQTKEYNIKVQEQKLAQAPTLQTKTIQTPIVQSKQEADVIVTPQYFSIWHMLYFVLGILFSVVVFLVYKIIVAKKDMNNDDIPLVKKIKQTSSSDELLKILVSYINIDQDLDRIIYSLENNYDKKEYKKLKKEVITLVKNIQIPSF